MPKLKSKNSLIRRIKVTKNGKLLRRRGFNAHLKVGKRKSTIRGKRRQVEITGYYAKKLKQILGI